MKALWRLLVPMSMADFCAASVIAVACGALLPPDVGIFSAVVVYLAWYIVDPEIKWYVLEDWRHRIKGVHHDE